MAILHILSWYQGRLPSDRIYVAFNTLWYLKSGFNALPNGLGNKPIREELKYYRSCQQVCGTIGVCIGENFTEISEKCCAAKESTQVEENVHTNPIEA